MVMISLIDIICLVWGWEEDSLILKQINFDSTQLREVTNEVKQLP